MSIEKLHNSNEQDENPILTEDLELGIGGSNVEIIAAKVNIPYLYLPEDQRRKLSTIVEEYLIPNLRDKLRMGKDAGLFTQEIKSLRERLDPSKMSIPDFWRQMRSVDSERIRLHSQVAQFLTSIVKGDTPDDEKSLAQAQSLYRRMLQVEPAHMAFSSRIKDFLNNWEDEVLPKHRLTREEQLLALTPSSMPYYVRFNTDLLRYRLSIGTAAEETEKSKLISLYFNNDSSQFQAYDEKRQLIPVTDERERKKLEEYISQTEEHFRNCRSRKLYFLQERKIPYSQDADNLLVMDNSLQGYFDSKRCFIHDIFLKMYLLANLKSLDFREMLQHTEDYAQEVIFYPDEELIGPTETAS